MFNASHILQTGGLLALALIIFAETGLLVGFFLPGDTLLIAAGVFAAQGKLPLIAVLPVAALAAIAGYQAGYQIGYRAGPKLFKRGDGIFRQEHLDRTQDFFNRHGRRAVLFARFIAIVRTVVPLVAGMGRMNKRQFWLFNIIGAVIWTFGVTLASYYLGRRVPNLDRYIIFLLVLAAVFTVGTLAVELIRVPARRKDIMTVLRTELRYLIKR